MGWASDALYRDVVKAGISSGLFLSGGLTIHGGNSGHRSNYSSGSSSKRKKSNPRFKRSSVASKANRILNEQLDEVDRKEKLSTRCLVYKEVMFAYYVHRDTPLIKRVDTADSVRTWILNLSKKLDANGSSLNEDTGEYESFSEIQADALRCIVYWTGYRIKAGAYNYNKYVLKDKFLQYAMPLVHLISMKFDEGSDLRIDYSDYVEMQENTKYNLI